MKKTLIFVFAITSLVTVSLVALKCRLKPPKKEVFNSEEPLKEDSKKAEIKVLGYIIRQVIKAYEKGINVVVFKYSNYLKKSTQLF